MSSSQHNSITDATMFGHILEQFSAKQNRNVHDIADAWVDETKTAFELLQTKAEIEKEFEERRIRGALALKLLLMHVIEEPLMRSVKEISPDFKKTLHDWLKSKFFLNGLSDGIKNSKNTIIYECCKYMAAGFIESYQQTRQCIADSLIGVCLSENDVVIASELDIISAANEYKDYTNDITFFEQKNIIHLMTRGEYNDLKTLGLCLSKRLKHGGDKSFPFPPVSAITAENMETVRQSMGLFHTENGALMATMHIPEGSFLGLLQGTYYSMKSFMTGDLVNCPKLMDSLDENVFTISDGFILLDNLNIFKFVNTSCGGNIYCTASGQIVSCKYIIPGCLLTITSHSKNIKKLRILVETVINANKARHKESLRHQSTFQYQQEVEAPNKKRKSSGSKKKLNAKKGDDEEEVKKSDQPGSSGKKKLNPKKGDDEEVDDEEEEVKKSDQPGKTLLFDV